MFEENKIPFHEHFGKPRPAVMYPSKTNGELITDDFIGVEVELENAAHIRLSGLWNIHEDGSLRNNGREFTFNVPLNGQVADSALVELAGAIKASRVKPDKSARTSVHVHVDCTDLNPIELARMIGLYAVFETVIFKTFAPNRFGNHFCLPFNDILEFRGIPRYLNSGWEKFEEEINIPDIGRYSALNVRSLFKFGTLEFRHHPGEYDVDRLREWVNCCLAFKRAARTQIDFKVNFFVNSTQGFVDHILLYFPRPVADRILTCYKDNIDQLNRDVIEGVRVAQAMFSPRIRSHS